MVAVRHGGVTFLFLVTVFVLRPVLNCVLSTCLSPDWWEHSWCQEMGILYPEYPVDTDGLNEFRKTLFDPTIVIWFQSGTDEWFRVAEVTTVHRNSSLGTAFDGRRVPGREDGAEESFHMCLKKPCTFKSSKTTNYRIPIHISKFAYSNGITEVPLQPNVAVPVGSEVGGPKPAQPLSKTGAWLSPWKIGLGVLILCTSATTKLTSAFPDMTAKQILTSGFRYACGFVINNVLTVFTSAESGFIEGLSDSLWTEPPWYFPWIIRFICYISLAHHFHLTHWVGRHVVSVTSRLWSCLCFKRSTAGSIPAKPIVAAQTKVNPPQESKSESEPGSEKTDYGCMAHCVYMNLELKKMPISQLPCVEIDVDDIELVFEDWASSLLPQFFKSGIPLCAVHASMYHSLRGEVMCKRKGCSKAGTKGPDGLSYCPDHIAQAVFPPPPMIAKVKFVDEKEKAQAASPKAGVGLVSDIILIPLIEQLRRGGFAKQSDLIDELTERYWGNVFENALHVRDMEAESDRLAREFEERLKRLDIVVEKPRVPPSPHDPKMPQPCVAADPVTNPPPAEASPAPSCAPVCIAASVSPVGSNPVVVLGRLVCPPAAAAIPVLLAAPPVSALFSTTPPSAPIPGVAASPGGALSETALLTSMVYHMDRIANPDVNPKPGTLDGIRRNDEIHVYVARGFDNFTVTLCPGVVGKQLAIGLKALNERLRPLYDLHQLPTGFSNRFCLGAACLTWGGRPKEDEWMISEADFPSWTPSEFDKFAPTAGWTLETRNRPSQHVETWKVNAVNMSKMFAAVYGQEWLIERVLAVEKLRSMHIAEPHKFTLVFIKDAWGTLNYRWAQELRDLTNLIRWHAKVERPTFEQIKMIGLTVVPSTGLTVFQKPTTFDLDNPSGYFLSEIVRKMMEDKELSSWSQYHGAPNRGTRDRVGGAVPDNDADNATPTGHKLPGPPMTPVERRVASNTAPKTLDGRKICWNYNSHMGCSESECGRAHEFFKNFAQLSTAVKISLAKRLGFKKGNKLSVNKVGEVVRELRKADADAANLHRAPPAARGDRNPSAPAALRVAGQRPPNPTHLEELDFLESEESLRKALHGGRTLFGETLPQDEDTSAGRVCNQIPPQSGDPKLAETIQLVEQMDKEPHLDFLRQASPHLSSFVRARVLQSLRGKSANVGDSTRAALESACTLGLPSLREEAFVLLEKPDRVGANVLNVNQYNHVTFGCPKLMSALTATPLCINEFQGAVYDFGDNIPQLPNDEIFDLYGKTIIEKNKCLLIHLDASLLSLRSTKVTENGILGIKQSEVSVLASELRLDQYKQASECVTKLGFSTGNESITIAELRSHAHDIIPPNHDRGYKSLICFPPQKMEGINIMVVRVSPSCNFSTHVIYSADPSRVRVYFLAYQEHLRLMLPLSKEFEQFLLTRPSSIARPLGWRHIFEFDSPGSSIDLKSLARCPHCQLPNVRLPEGVYGAIVGRSVLLSDVQLREFKAETPWTREAAAQHGPAALECWEDEENTPPLDEPPECDSATLLCLEELLGSIPEEDTPFCLDTWAKIAYLSDVFVKSAGDLLTAAHLYISAWRRLRGPTTLTVERLRCFDGLVSRELFQYAMDIATRGVLPKGDKMPVRFAQEPYSSINDDVNATASSLWEDVLKGRMFVITSDSEPYLGNLMESKLAAVVQKDVCNPSMNKVRYISDPRLEVNERMCKLRHPKCVAPRHANVARRILFWQRRYPGVPVMISKRDVKGAFKLIPVSVKGLCYMGCRVANFVCVYLSLFFGWRPSPANWGIIASLLMQFIASHAPSNTWSEGPESYVAF